MCGIWTQKQWEDAANKPASVYSMVGRFQNAAGEVALQVKESYPGDTYYWNIYSEDGQKHAFYYDQTKAVEAMGKQGFTTALPLVATETTETQTTPDDGQVRVQGKTLEEWKEQGRLNNEREKHVHPTDPEGEPNEAEIAAFEASLSEDEKEFLELSTLVNALGLASAFA